MGFEYGEKICDGRFSARAGFLNVERSREITGPSIVPQPGARWSTPEEQTTGPHAGDAREIPTAFGHQACGGEASVCRNVFVQGFFISGTG